MTFKPFREEYDILNRCEIASLFVSNITFTSGLLFNDGLSGRAMKIVAAVGVIGINLCLIMSYVGVMSYYLYM